MALAIRLAKIFLGVPVLLLASSLGAVSFDPVPYDARGGSLIVDACAFCGRVSDPQAALRGTFTLKREPVRIAGELYTLSNLALSDPSGNYTVTGSGTYYLNGDSPPAQLLELEVTINGVSGIKLASGPLKVLTPWPAIDIRASESFEAEPRDPAHVYSLRLVAAPRVEMTCYELVKPGLEGSLFIDDCTICGRPTIPVPIAGTFLLGEIAGGPNPVKTYRVDEIDFRNAEGDLRYHITGTGIYQVGGEVALLQSMALEVQVNDEAGVQLASDLAGVPVALPAIDIELAHQNPASPLHVYSLRILAQPCAAPPGPSFRRGDANGDGGVDISDGIHILLWRFAGGAQPQCLETADTNDDEGHDLSDAVYVLAYLFQGGPPPPPPGPTTCGTGATLSLGCDSYPPCGGV